MANEYRVYLNTLIFTLVACATLLSLLLSLMFVPLVATYSVFCITLSIGLLVVVIGAIVRIALYERRMRLRTVIRRDNAFAVKSCPDYYTATYLPSGVITCANGFVTSDRNTKVTFNSGPASIDLSTYDKLTMSQVCAKVDPSDTTAPIYNIPWTTLRSACTI